MRFAIIDLMDCVFFDSDDIEEIYDIYSRFGKDNFRGIYDYEQDRYLDLVDIIDLTGVQIHSQD